LVAKSLVCLRSCLEALHIKAAGRLKDPLHQSCSGSDCQFLCFDNLHRDLTAYLNELDRVFFLKENMHNREPWWLSAFYSFCIQGLVRRGLIDLLTTQPTGLNHYAAAQHLHLAIRMFSVIMKHDPLIDESSFITQSHVTGYPATGRRDHFREARLAVQQANWESNGIRSSAEYLKQLFEVDGASFRQTGPTSTPRLTAVPGPGATPVGDLEI
jgi:hypothetical protein